MKEVIIDPKHTAILAIDLQQGYCSPHGKMSKLGFDVKHFPHLIKKIERFLIFARTLSVPIIFTRMIEDPAYMAENARLKFVLLKNTVITSPKTKEFIGTLKNLGLTSHVLIITEQVSEELYLASRNLHWVDVRDVMAVDPVSLVRFEKVVITVPALKQFEEMLG